MARDHDLASGSHAFAAGLIAGRTAAAAAQATIAATSGADALSDVPEAVRLTGALFFLVDAAEPWIADAPDSPTLSPAIRPRVPNVVSYQVVTGAAFSRAFRKITGIAPGAWRHQPAAAQR